MKITGITNYTKKLLPAFFALLILNACNSEIKQNIPVMPDLSAASPQLKSQIESANKSALRKPNDKNLGWLGMVYYSSNHYDKAAQCFELATQQNREAWQWNYYRGSLHMELGESKEAAQQMQEVTLKQPQEWIAWYRLGDIYQQMDSTKLAEKSLKRITQLDTDKTYIKNTPRSTYYPLQVYAQVLLGKIHAKNNQEEKAEKELLNASNNYPTFGPAFRQLEVFYAQQGNPELGNKYRERANDLRVFNFPLDTLMDRLSLISCSEAYVLKQIDNAMQGNDTKWSYELIKKARENNPDSKYVLSKAIRQFCLMGFGEEAVPLLQDHIAIFNSDHDELVQIGILLADAGYRSEAQVYLSTALEIPNLTTEQQATIAGLLFTKTGEGKKSVEAMTEVALAEPKNSKIIGDATFLMLQMGNMEQAEKYFEQLKKLDANNSKVSLFRGILAEQSGDTRKAVVLFEKAYDADPKNKFLIQHLTQLYYQEELWSNAIAFFQKALKTFPNDAELQMQLGLLWVTCPDENLRNLVEGKEYSERAFYNSRYSNTNKVSSGRTLAIAHSQLGNTESARFYLDQTIDFAVKSGAPEGYIQNLRALAQQL